MKLINYLGIALLTMFFATLCMNVHAVPAYPYPIKVTQPDGSTITVQIFGDEYFWYTTTSDGYNIVKAQDGFYYYANIQNANQLVATEMRANDPMRRSNAEREFIKKVNKGFPAGVALTAGNQQRMAMGAFSDQTQVPYYEQRAEATRNGDEFKSLVILVDFSDISFSYPKSNFENLLMQDGYSANGGTGSAWNYYFDNSNGQFNPKFEVVGPVKVSNTAKYYAGDSGTAYATNMVIEACNLAYNQGLVNFGDYADGTTVRDIFIFYAGDNMAEGGTGIWPHRMPSRGTPLVTLGGYSVYAYACTSEKRGAGGNGGMAGIGTFCHEFGHVLSWPDFYDTDYETNGESFGLGNFSLMSGGAYNNGGRTPPALSAFEKSEVGWLNLETLTQDGTYTLDPIYNSDPAVPGSYGYKIETGNAGEYFVLEYRHGNDARPWDNFWANGDSSVGMTGSPGSGIMVYQVDKSNNKVSGSVTAASTWNNNKVNAYSAHPCYRIIMAQQITGSTMNRYGYVLFPGAGGLAEITYENGHLRSWADEHLGIDIVNIVEGGNKVEFNVVSSLLSNLNTISGQFDVTLTFDSAANAQYKATCTPVSGGNSISAVSTKGLNTMNVPGLKPNTEYIVYMSTKNGASKTEEITFTTLSTDSSKVPTIDMDPTYSVGSTVVMKVINLSGDVSSIKWYYDNAVVDAATIKVISGQRTVKCEVKNSDGSQEVLYRYITGS